MAITNYTELQAAVGRWLSRRDLATVIPDLITIGEASLKRQECVYKLFTATLTTVPGERDFFITDLGDTPNVSEAVSKIRSLSFINQTRAGTVEITTPERLAEYARTRWGVASSFPLAAALVGKNTLRFGPTPDAAYDLDAVLESAVTPLSDGTPSNWLLQEEPDLYLFASLTAAEPYMKNDERLAMWQASLTKGLTELSQKREREQFPGQMIARPSRSIGGR